MVINPYLRFILICMLFGIIFSGCAGHSSQPVIPDDTSSQQELSGNVDATADMTGNSHYLLSSGLIYIDTENPDDP
ncbi:MAG: hypothetical protein NTY09_12710, partial [bacterium]|nr:hypothetical protein [bacterium]